MAPHQGPCLPQAAVKTSDAPSVVRPSLFWVGHVDPFLKVRNGFLFKQMDLIAPKPIVDPGFLHALAILEDIPYLIIRHPTMTSPICGSLGLSLVGLITEIASSGSHPHFPLGRVSYVQIYFNEAWSNMRFHEILGYLRPLSLGDTTCCSRTPSKKEWSRWDYTVNSAKMSHSWWISNWRSRQKNSFTKHRQLGKSAIPLEAWEVVL